MRPGSLKREIKGVVLLEVKKKGIWPRKPPNIGNSEQRQEAQPDTQEAPSRNSSRRSPTPLPTSHFSTFSLFYHQCLCGLDRLTFLPREAWPFERKKAKHLQFCSLKKPNSSEKYSQGELSVLVAAGYYWRIVLSAVSGLHLHKHTWQQENTQQLLSDQEPGCGSTSTGYM